MCLENVCFFDLPSCCNGNNLHDCNVCHETDKYVMLDDGIIIPDGKKYTCAFYGILKCVNEGLMFVVCLHPLIQSKTVVLS